MELLVFAHRGEAQTFLKELNVIFQEESLGFYQSKDRSIGILVCGEGAFEVMSKLPYIISKYGVSSIINFGVAGALDSKLEIGGIYQVRTAYSYLETKPQFKSYTLQAEVSKAIDCISSIERVTDTNRAKTLSHFAGLVDREIWSIAAVASTLKVPLTSYKIVSDFADSSTDCLSIKDKALEFSNALFDIYVELKPQTGEQENTPSLEGINASFTQRKRIEKLASLLKINYPAKELKDYIEAFSKDLTIRANVQEFCLFLEKNLNTVETQIFSEIQHILAPLRDVGASVVLDQKKSLVISHFR